MDPKVEFPEYDRATREWFAIRHWPVIDTFTDADAEIHAWRHRGIQGNYTLHITREVLDRNDSNALPEMLDEWNAEAASEA